MLRRTSVFLYLSLFLLILIATMYKNYGASDCLSYFLSDHLEQDSPELISCIRNQILHKPSEKEYNLEGAKSKALWKLEDSELFYKKVSQKLFSNKRNGFFTEAGALNGEDMSNSLWLEKEMGWTGLLVEPDELSFKHLLRKNRKAWSANVCLSPHPYPAQVEFLQSETTNSFMINSGFKYRAMNRLTQISNPEHGLELKSGWHTMVQCLPLTSLLLALDVKTVDLVILDVEGSETEIFKHFDLNNFNVQVLYLEHIFTANSTLIDFIHKGGYELVEQNTMDFVFVKNNSVYYKMYNESLTYISMYTFQNKET